MRALVLAGMRERWGDRFDPAANPDADDVWGSYVARGAEVVVVAVVEEAGGGGDAGVVATGTLVPQADGSGRILRVAVDRRHRRRGLARLVVAELVERAGRRALDRVVVTTDTAWPDAVALYRSCGFGLVAQTAGATDLSMFLAPTA